MPKEVKWDGIDEVKLANLINSGEWLLKGWHRKIAEKASGAIDTLNDNLTEAYTALEREEKRTSLLQKKLDYLQATVKQKNDELVAVEESYHREKRNFELTQQGEAALHNRIEEDRATLSSHQTTIVNQKKHIASLKEDNEILEAANSQLNKTLDNYDQAVAKLEKDNIELMEISKKGDAKIAELEGKLVKLKNQILFILEDETNVRN